MKKVIALLLVGIVFTLQACNTVRGAGRDIERTGEAIQGK
ncbi:MAG: entericidin A/B family lipoprotein [Desulfuromonadales bacterium]|nr:entericidin A/B family lipoprotein [Desulfuromonadales bacterium]